MAYMDRDPANARPTAAPGVAPAALPALVVDLVPATGRQEEEMEDALRLLASWLLRRRERERERRQAPLQKSSPTGAERPCFPGAQMPSCGVRTGT